MKTFRVIVVSIIFSSFFLGCDVTLQKRIDGAEVLVNDAKRVNANKYAPKEIQEATKALNEAKKALAVKQKKQTEAKIKKTEEFANKAYFKSLNKFVLFQNYRTKKQMNAARENGADIQVPEIYQKGKKLADQVQEDLRKVKELQEKLKDLETKKKKS